MRSLLRLAQPRGVTMRLYWTVASFGGLQVIRLATNVVLTRLLAPEMLGVMQLINAVRTGAELLSDVGISQNIVASRNGENPSFLRTAWTLQAIRGVLIAAILAASASAIARLYALPDLAALLAVAAAIPLLDGLQSPGRFLLQRRHGLKQLAVFEVSVAIAAAGVQIAISWYDRSTWSLVYGAAAASLMFSLFSHWLLPAPAMRPTLDRQFVGEIIRFGKWIFLSTALYFIATNIDRLYLAHVVPMAVLGIYGIARSLSDMFGLLVGRIGNMVVFPAVAASRLEGRAIDARVRTYRRNMLILAALGLGGFVAISDLVIQILYDDRYVEAARILPVLLLGVWCGVLSSLGESMLLGRGKPNYGTLGNGLKLAWIGAGMPLAFVQSGFAGMVVVIAAADLVRYVPLAWGQSREKLFFPRQDLAATLVLLAAAYFFRQVFHLIGLTEGWAALWG